MGNPLSTFGLMMQGADKARAVDREDRAGNTDIANAQRRGLAMDQARVAADQLNATGAMGLDTARQTKATADAVREAQAAATQQGKTWSGSLMSGAEAAAAKGDTQLALQLKQQYQALEQMGTKELIHNVMTNPVPGERPDLLKIVQQYEKTRDATAVSLDDTGNITVMSATKGPVKFNTGKLAEIMGMVPEPKFHNITAGGRAVVTQPGREPVTIDAPKTYAENPQQGYEKRTVKDADGNERQQIIDIRQTIAGKQNPNYGKEVGDSGGGLLPSAGTNVRKDLPVLKEITDGVSALGEEYGKTDMTNPLNPKIILTQKGQQVALVAEQLRLANQSLAPRTAIDMALKGKPMWKTENGKRSAVVLYNGQEFPMSTPQSSTAVAEPAAAPVQEPEAAGPARAPAAAQPKKPAPSTAARDQRKMDPELEAKSPELKRLGDLLRMGTKSATLDANYWIKYATLAKKLGGKGYSKGGKVHQSKHYGLE